MDSDSDYDSQEVIPKRLRLGDGQAAAAAAVSGETATDSSSGGGGDMGAQGGSGRANGDAAGASPSGQPVQDGDNNVVSIHSRFL